MAEKKKEAPEPEKKEKEKEEVKCETAGGLRWLITYADMITLLLGVFIILCSSGGISESKFKAMATAFSRVFSIFEGGGEKRPEKGEIKKASSERMGYRIAGVSVFNQRYIEQIEHGFKEEKRLGLVRILPTQDGIKISLQDRLFFREGSTQIQIGGGEKTLNKIRDLLSGMSNKVIIEAHTTNIKPKGYPSNWELSSERANAIFEYLTERGLDKKRFRVSSFADTKPAILSNPANPKNNRIDIVILE
ncbi:MAG: flagellar motor protein MotB [bacterium]